MSLDMYLIGCRAFLPSTHPQTNNRMYFNDPMQFQWHPLFHPCAFPSIPSLPSNPWMYGHQLTVVHYYIDDGAFHATSLKTSRFQPRSPIVKIASTAIPSALHREILVNLRWMGYSTVGCFTRSSKTLIYEAASRSSRSLWATWKIIHSRWMATASTRSIRKYVSLSPFQSLTG